MVCNFTSSCRLCAPRDHSYSQVGLLYVIHWLRPVVDFCVYFFPIPTTSVWLCFSTRGHTTKAYVYASEVTLLYRFCKYKQTARVSKGQVYKYVLVIHELPLIPSPTNKKVPGHSVTNWHCRFARQVPSYILRLYNGYTDSSFCCFPQHLPPNVKILTLWSIKGT
jgi:hypothetical protein